MPRKPSSPQREPAANDRQHVEYPKYSISVASDLSGVPEQQLRRMEESGLVSPSRTRGNTRRYSDADMAQISEVSTLASEGVNMAGIQRIQALRREVEALRREVEVLRREVKGLRSRERDRPAQLGAPRRFAAPAAEPRRTPPTNRQPERAGKSDA